MSDPWSDREEHQAKVRELEEELANLHKEVGGYFVLNRVLDWLLQGDYPIPLSAREALVKHLKAIQEEIRA